MDTYGYHVSDVGDNEFHREDPNLNNDTVYRPCKDTPFSPTGFNEIEMGSVVHNQNLIDDQEDKKTHRHHHQPQSLSNSRSLLGCWEVVTLKRE